MENDYYMPVPVSNENAATEAIVHARTAPLLQPDNSRMDADPSTPKCSKMESAINARTANLDAAARKLKGGGPENALPELP